ERSDPAERRWGDMQHVVEDEDEDQSEPEDGHRDSAHAEDPRQMVPDAVALDCAQDAHGQRDQEREESAEGSQLKARRQALAEVEGNRVACVPGLTKVTANESGKVALELDRQWLVQPHLLLEKLDGRWDLEPGVYEHRVARQ